MPTPPVETQADRFSRLLARCGGRGINPWDEWHGLDMDLMMVNMGEFLGLNPHVSPTDILDLSIPLSVLLAEG